MITPAPKDVKLVLTTLGQPQFMRLVRVVMGLRTPEDWVRPLAAGPQLTMYLYEWLLHLGFLSDDQVRWVLNEVVADLVRQFGVFLDREYDNLPCTRIPVGTVTVTDKRYVTHTGATAWADVQDERFLAHLARPGVTHIACDMFALFQVKQDWLKRLHGGRDAGHQHHAADRARQEDAGQGGRAEDPHG